MSDYIIRPQEIYLLERYSSPAYFKQMRDAFADMIEVAEYALDLFVNNLPFDYRSRPLNMQPDIVWGERVLPNLRSTLDSLNTGYQQLLNGDLDAIAYGGNVKSDFRAINMDYPIDWMSKQQQLEYDKWEREASFRAFNMKITSYYGWKIGSLTDRYNKEARGALNPPESWPIYRLNPKYSAGLDEIVPIDGIYVPDRKDASAQVLLKGMQAMEAYIGYDPETMQAVGKAPVNWMLVERIADSGGGSQYVTPKRLRCESGKPCPQTGYWWTPASKELMYFKKNDVMPKMKRLEWKTIWYFNETNQLKE